MSGNSFLTELFDSGTLLWTAFGFLRLASHQLWFHSNPDTDRTLTVTLTPSQCIPEINGNEGVLWHTAQEQVFVWVIFSRPFSVFWLTSATQEMATEIPMTSPKQKFFRQVCLDNDCIKTKWNENNLEIVWSLLFMSPENPVKKTFNTKESHIPLTCQWGLEYTDCIQGRKIRSPSLKKKVVSLVWH